MVRNTNGLQEAPTITHNKESKTIEVVFPTVLGPDFLEGEINHFVLEALASPLFFVFRNPNWISNKDSELSSALDTASDMVYFFERKDKDDNCSKRVKEILKTLRDYHKRNRHLLDEIREFEQEIAPTV